jgi:hypothetical protein
MILRQEPQLTTLSTEICILHGCRVPVILRQREQKSPSAESSGSCVYKFGCEAYVHGMMDGEALDVQDNEDIPAQWFELQ